MSRDQFAVTLDAARAAYARGLAGCPADRNVASETLGLWHRMLARPPRFTRVEAMDKATRSRMFNARPKPAP